MRAQAPAILHPPGGAIVLIGSVGPRLGPQLFLQATLGLLDALGARARHRPRLLFALRLQAPLGLAQPRAAPLPGR
jgi:hypothetical protein